MSRMRWMGLLLLVVLVAGCNPGRTKTEKLLFDWANALNLHLTTEPSSNYTFPQRLEEVSPVLRGELSFEDAWDNPLHYRRLRDDLYQLISPGPNGKLGDSDDVIVEKGILQNPEKVYAANPIS